MKKAIILARVSTQQQDTTSQVNELVRIATADGYNESEIEIISEKESAVSLDFQHRESLQRMVDIIENTPSIEIVYVWEVSRIARRKDVAEIVLRYLKERKIQLVAQTPSIRLFDNNGNVDSAADLTFTLFSHFAEEEAMKIKARMKRGKAALQAEGKFIGGVVKYGYKVIDKVFHIDESQAKVIHTIFEKYLQLNSTMMLARELKQLGITKVNNAGQQVQLTKKNILQILKDSAYIGEKNYPKIVEKSLFDMVQSKLKENNTTATKSKRYFFGSKVLKCGVCGGSYIAIGNSYKCGKHVDYSNLEGIKCDNKECIGINIFDSLIWLQASKLYGIALNERNENTIASNKKKAFELGRKIEVANEELDNIQAKKDKASMLFIDGIISESVYNRKLSSIQQEESLLQANLSQFKADLRNTEHLIQQSENNPNSELDFALKEIDIVEGLRNGKLSYESMYQVVRQTIQFATIEESTIQIEGKYHHCKKVTFFDYKGYDYSMYYLYRRNTLCTNVWGMQDNGTPYPIFYQLLERV